MSAFEEAYGHILDAMARPRPPWTWLAGSAWGRTHGWAAPGAERFSYSRR